MAGLKQGSCVVRARIFLALSLVINAVLLVALIVWLRPPPAALLAVRPIDRLSVISNNPIRIVKTNILVRPIDFSWLSVESSDYVTYIANLRTIGCPETTVRDIIVADVNQLFARKRNEDAGAQDQEWWRAEASQELQRSIRARAGLLEDERRALLTKLLGPKWNDGPAPFDPAIVPLAGPVLGALPEETKKAVRAISARSRERLQAYLEELGGTFPGVAEMAKLREKTRTELAEFLNPAQLEEFQLRHSSNSAQLRQEVKGIEPTPDEFRALFRATDALDRELALLAGSSDAASVKKREELERDRLVALKTALTPERFAAYQIAEAANAKVAGDPALEISEVASDALLDIKKAVALEQERIRNDKSLTAEQRAALNKFVQEQQKKAEAKVLGLELPEPTPTPEPVLPSGTHLATPGETIAHLSLTYGVRMSAIREANPGVNFSQLKPGQTVIIPPPTR